MKCRSIINKLSEYLSGELSATEKTAIAAHLEQCAACRSEEAAFRRAEEALQSLATLQSAPELTDDLHRRLAVPAAQRFPWVRVAAASAALAGVIVLVLWLRPDTTHFTRNNPLPYARPPAAETRQDAARTQSPHPVPQVTATTAVSPHSRHRRMSRHSIHRLAAAKRNLPPVNPDKPSVESASGQQDPTESVLLIVVTGVPEPPPPVSSYQAEVSLPDGTATSFEQTVSRDENGFPREIKIALENTLAQRNGQN